MKGRMVLPQSIKAICPAGSGSSHNIAPIIIMIRDKIGGDER